MPNADLGPQAWLEEAARIAALTQDKAIRTQSGATWLTLAYYPQAQRWQIQPMTARFYDGICGTLLFLGAASRCLGLDSSYQRLIEEGDQSVRAFLKDAYSARYLFEVGTGAGLGASSLVYAMSHLGAILDDARYLETAELAAQFITESHLQEDSKFDLLAGNAGAIVSFLTLYRQTGKQADLDKAILAGEHLLKCATKTDSGLGWQTMEAQLILGFSHGTAGIAMALARLTEATGDPRFAEAGHAACQYENSRYQQSANNWPDRRYPKTTQGFHFDTRWCHGAPGIALGRANMIHAGCSQRNYFDDVHNGIRRTMEEPLTPLDHWCCGNLGRAATMQVSGSVLGEERWKQSALTLTDQVLARKMQVGNYGLGVMPGLDMVSFHQGLAGIGYHYLWMAHPEKVPSVLQWA